MLRFNELRITSDNKCLIVDIQVEGLSYFENVKIDSILLDTQDTWISSGPSDTAALLYSQDNSSLDTIKDSAGKHVRLEVGQPLISPSENNMYFVYVVADISNASEVSEAPCDCSEDCIVGAVVNLHTLYSTLMDGIREVENSCDMPVNLVNSFLREQVVEACLKTGNYPLAIKYWKEFFLSGTGKTVSKSCGCNGRT